MRKSSLFVVALLALSAAPTLAEIASDDRRVYLHGGGIDFSFLEGFLGDLGVEVDLPDIDIDLPPRAESAVADALDRADAALDRVFGDGGVLDGIDDNVEGLLDDALDGVQDTLDSLDLPVIEVPDVNEIIEDALAGVETILPAETEQIVNDALDGAQQSVDDALDQVFGEGGVLDEINDLVPEVTDRLDGLDVDGVLNDVLGEGGVVDQALSDLPTDRLPAVATEAIENAAGIVEQVLGDLFGQHDQGDDPSGLEIASLVTSSAEPVFRSVSFAMLPSSSSAASVPEPATGLLALACLMASPPRRRR